MQPLLIPQNTNTKLVQFVSEFTEILYKTTLNKCVSHFKKISLNMLNKLGLLSLQDNNKFVIGYFLLILMLHK